MVNGTAANTIPVRDGWDVPAQQTHRFRYHDLCFGAWLDPDGSIDTGHVGQGNRRRILSRQSPSSADGKPTREASWSAARSAALGGKPHIARRQLRGSLRTMRSEVRMIDEFGEVACHVATGNPGEPVGFVSWISNGGVD